MREKLQPLPDDNILTVTCGQLSGLLHRDRFFCPGIHRECIEIDGVFFTPKRFSVMGAKERLKDWKNAVRLNGVQLRKYIDTGILAFSNHETMCTGRCIARAPGTRTGPNANAILLPEVKSPLGMVTTVTSGNMMQIENVRSSENWGYDSCEDMEDVKPDINQLQMQMLQAQSLAVSKAPTFIRPPASVALPGVPVYPTHISKAVPMVIPDLAPENISEEDFEDRLLWKGIVELGLIDEFFREIKASLDVLKNGMIKRQVPIADSRKISVIVKQLGLMQKLKYKLEAHQTDMERQRMKLDREMEDLQRKVREFEAKKALLKRKSECFEQLLDITTPKTEPSWAEETDSPTAYKRMCVGQVENGSGQLVVFPQQMMTPANSSNDHNESSVNSSIVAANGSASSTQNVGEAGVSVTKEPALNYMIAPAVDPSWRPQANSDDYPGVQGSSVTNTDTNYTGLKVKVRRGRKRKPREIPRLDPSEEFTIAMDQSMDEETGHNECNESSSREDIAGGKDECNESSSREDIAGGKDTCNKSSSREDIAGGKDTCNESSSREDIAGEKDTCNESSSREDIAGGKDDSVTAGGDGNDVDGEDCSTTTSNLIPVEEPRAITEEPADESTDPLDESEESCMVKFTGLKVRFPNMHSIADVKNDTTYTGLKVKVRRGRKRKPREIPRMDSSEEFAIAMDQSMNKDVGSAMTSASRDSLCSDNADGWNDDGQPKMEDSSGGKEDSVNAGGDTADREADGDQNTSVESKDGELPSPCKDAVGAKGGRRGRKPKYMFQGFPGDDSIY